MGGEDETSVRVRPAQPEDRAAVIDLWQRCGLTVAYNDPGKDFDLARGGPASDVLVAEDDRALVAAVMVGHDGHRGWLYYVGVDPDRRDEGLGAGIVRAAESWLAARGVPKVMLMVRQTNTVVEGFYHALGYETAPRIVMQKWLSPPP